MVADLRTIFLTMFLIVIGMQGKTDVVDCVIADMVTLNFEGQNVNKQRINDQLGKKYTLIEENSSLIVIMPNKDGEKIKRKFQFLGSSPYDKTYFSINAVTVLLTVDHNVFEEPSFATQSANGIGLVNSWLLHCNP